MAGKPIRGVLAQGQLTGSRLVLYTVPDGMRAEVNWITGSNQAVGSVDALFFLRRQGDTREIGRATLAATGAAVRILDDAEVLFMEEGDAIEGRANAANAIDYTIAGAEALLGP